MKLTMAAATLAFAIAAAVLPFILRDNHLSTNMDALLPDDPWIEAHLDFLRNSQLGSTAAISLEAGPGADPGKLARFAENFAKLAEKEPSIKKVFFKIPPDEATEALGFLCSRIPQTFSPDDLNELEKLTSPKSLEATLRGHYRDLTRPGAIFRQKLFAADPLNLHKRIIDKLRSLAGDSGFRFHIRDDGLWSEDDSHLLVLVRTDAPISDAGRGEEFVKAVRRCLENSKPSKRFNYIIMAGHRHAVDNRRLLRRDIAVTMAVAAAGFILLFAFLFRDWRAIFVFAVPFLGMGSAIGLTWLFFDGPSAVILGMGATVIGIALDYGIHVFVAAKDSLSNTSLSEDQSIDNAVAAVRRPIIFSALTTLGVFWAFFLSSSPGYHQLAFASTCGIALSVWISLTCLPLLFKVGEPKPSRRSPYIAKLADAFTALHTRSKVRSVVAVWIAILAVSGFFAVKVGFQPNIRSLDGISDRLRNDEREFRGIWGES
ncbi:MAG: MMPL family transporter, partial [Kiritimatiellaeota bacterium]|nr:MMPL family transporter [Kiritimatiellota bacterium]